MQYDDDLKQQIRQYVLTNLRSGSTKVDTTQDKKGENSKVSQSDLQVSKTFKLQEIVRKLKLVLPEKKQCCAQWQWKKDIKTNQTF